MKTLIITVLLIILVPIIFIVLASANTNAQENNENEITIFSRAFQRNMTCSSTDFVNQDLKGRLQTVKVWWGLDHNDNLTELFLNQSTGKWFFMISFPDKITCGLVGGDMSVPYDTNPYFK
jgi:ABC-type glycerol-3-phosphate transport system permease component|tara:strand:- start:723 stop:1085 length:363 start_codon:yes stop_codon:yes gene_type:complete